jgi:hypothetical protein
MQDGLLATDDAYVRAYGHRTTEEPPYPQPPRHLKFAASNATSARAGAAQGAARTRASTRAGADFVAALANGVSWS